MGNSAHRGHRPHDHGSLPGGGRPVSENIPGASFCCESLGRDVVTLISPPVPGYGPCFQAKPTGGGRWVALLPSYPITIACAWQTLLIVPSTFSAELAEIQTSAAKLEAAGKLESRVLKSKGILELALDLPPAFPPHPLYGWDFCFSHMPRGAGSRFCGPSGACPRSKPPLILGEANVYKVFFPPLPTTPLSPKQPPAHNEQIGL